MLIDIEPPIRRYELELDAALAHQLTHLSAEIGVSIDHLVFSGWLLLLHQVADQDEIAVHVAHARAFIYTSHFKPQVSWQIFAALTSARLIDAEATQTENVEANDTPDTPLAHRVTLHGCEAGYWMGTPSAETAGIAVQRGWRVASEGTNERLTLHCMTTSPGKLAIRHLQQLQSMLRALMVRRHEPVGAISAIGAEERARVIGFNDTAHAYPADRTLVELVAQWMRSDTARTALGDNEVTLSRGALMQQACNLAQHLIDIGVAKGDPVALLMERDASMVVATLAVLIAGGVYCPIDPSYPEARVRYYLEDTRAKVLLVSGEAAKTLSSKMTFDGAFSGRVVRADRHSIARLSTASIDDLLSRATLLPGDPAYIMYTSGTTGTPKGVLVTHRGVARLVCGARYVQLAEDTRMLQAGAIGFDAATFEIWGALLNGGELHVIDRDALLSPRLFEEFVARRRCNTALLTSSLFAMMANESPAIFRHFRSIVVGGDVVPAKQVQSVRRLCPGLTVINAYGPTENAVISTAHIVSDDDALDIPIGKPISNTTAYVLSRHRQLQPIGVPGELYVGGAGIGPGYLNKPEQTAASFVTVEGLGGETLYRTGDIVSWRENGVLDFLGRRDHQVKIRGLRVEIGEIERQLLAAAQIEEAVVLCRKVGSHGDPVLTACFKAPVKIDIAVLRDSMRKRLPPHMVPSNFEQLDVMPLTANGKVDRRLLLERCSTRVSPVASNTAAALDAQADRDDLTSMVVRELAALLERPDISASANFLALGGSSLTAALLASRLEAMCQRRCTASDILNSDSLEQFASMLAAAPALTGGAWPRAMQSQAGSAGGGVGVGRRRMASTAQKQIFVEQEKDPQSTAYNLPLEIIVPRGRIDTARLRDALQRVVDHHETMRTSFAADGSEVVRQVQPKLEAGLEFVELDGAVSGDATLPDAYGDWARRWVRPFDLASAPLWRVAVVNAGDATHLLFDFHHIIVDGKSIVTLLDGLSDAYGRTGQPDDHSLNDASFDRYVDWMTSEPGAERIAHNEAFWKTQFGDWTAPADLPTDYPRPPVRGWRGGASRFSLGAGLSARVEQFALAHRVTPYSVLLCAYALWLASVTGESEATIGTAAAGRSMAGCEEIAGLFVNTVCLRVDVGVQARTQTVSEWITASARKINRCLDHQDYPFLRLVEQFAPDRRFDRHPLFDSMFSMQNTGMAAARYWGSPITWRPEYTGASLFDLNLQVEIGQCEFTAIWTYNAQLFSHDTVERLAEHWLSIVERVVRDGALPMSALLADPAVGLHVPDAGGPSRLPSISFTL